MNGIKRIISVAEEDRKELEEAVSWALKAVGSGLLGKAGVDIYDYIKSHLSKKNISHKDEHTDPKDVPQGKAY